MTATSKAMADLELLRSRRKQHDTQAEEYRVLASQHGVEAVRISREIADFPCDVPRSRDELITHLGWHHKRRPPLGATKKMMIALHERIVGEEGNGKEQK